MRVFQKMTKYFRFFSKDSGIIFIIKIKNNLNYLLFMTYSMLE